MKNGDAVAYLDPLCIEWAHRLPAPVGPRNQPSPRVLILKFLNFQDKIRVIPKARAKGKVMYEDQEIMFFPDLSADLHQKRKGYDG